jgi:hypothetical protein
MSWPVLSLELPLEKQLALKIVEYQFRQLSREQAIDLLIETNRQLAIQHQALKSALGPSRSTRKQRLYKLSKCIHFSASFPGQPEPGVWLYPEQRKSSSHSAFRYWCDHRWCCYRDSGTRCQRRPTWFDRSTRRL